MSKVMTTMTVPTKGDPSVTYRMCRSCYWHSNRGDTTQRRRRTRRMTTTTST
jgi:hypothetical protein